MTAPESPLVPDPQAASIRPEPIESLDRSLVLGLAWTAGFRWIGQLLSWVVTLYAARVLAPGDYGLISMAMLGLGLARMVQDCGLDSILVQDRLIVGERQARLAGLIVALGVVLWGLFALLAEPMSWFFREPALALIVVVLGVVFVTDALQVVPRAQMQRELKYSQLAGTAFVQLAANQIALVIAIRAGLGYWSLVAGTITGEIVVTIVLLRLSPFQVAWPREIRNLAAPLLSGWRILASRIASYSYTNADQTIIGRFLGKDQLGIYSFATTFSSLPQQQVGSIVSGVIPGILSQVQDQPRELRRYFLRLTEFVTVLSFPMSVGTALVADLVMPLVLGPQWGGMILPLRVLCAYSVFQAAQMMVGHTLLWTGQFRVYMWCSVLAGVVMPPVLAAGAHFFQLPGVTWAWALIFPIANLPSFFYAFRTAQMTVLDWLDSLKPALTGCVVMAAAVLTVRQVLPADLNPWGFSATAIGTGAVAYTATLWFGFRVRMQAAVQMGRTIRSTGAVQMESLAGTSG